MGKLDCLVPVGDPHCGSKFGLMPPWVRTNYGTVTGHSLMQRWLWAKWRKLSGRWLDDYLASPKHANATRTSCRWGLICMGDMVEGHHHDNADEIVDGDMMTHARIAEAVYQPLADEADEVYMVRGTRTHARNLETQIGEALGATPDPMQSNPLDDDSQEYCWEHLLIEIKGCLCSFQHHIGGGGLPWTRGGNLARALAAEQLCAVKLRMPVPYVVVRAHAHHADKYGPVPQGLCVITGPWKTIDPFGRKATKEWQAIPSMQVLDFRKMSMGLPHLEMEVALPEKDQIPTMKH